MLIRFSDRKPDEIRKISFETNYNPYAEGSCLVKFGNSHVICTASIEEKTPHFLKGTGKGWVTAEYSMLPRSTHTRMDRDSSKGKLNARAVEIQRLIGRSLRAGVNFNILGERQIIVDCDVIQADGGTRTAAISGGFVAMYLACQKLVKERKLREMPIKNFIAAISCGIYENTIITDLDYNEDSKAMVDSNFIINENEEIIEIQGTAEERAFSEEELFSMLKYAKKSVKEIINLQKKAVGILD